MFLLGMCTWLSNEYGIKSNQEVGKERCDIILKPRYEKVPGYVIELKYVKEEIDLEEVVKQAIEQLQEKQCDIGLGKEVIYIGMVHNKKEVEVAWCEKG